MAPSKSWRSGIRTRRASLILLALLFASSAAAADSVIFKSDFNHENPAFSPDGKRLALLGYMRLRIVDPLSGRVLAANDREVPEDNRLTWTSDGTQIVTFGDHLALWDAKTLRLLSIMKLPNYARAAAVKPGGETIALGMDDGGIRIYDITTKQLTAARPGHIEPVNVLLWNKKGDTLYSASGFGDNRICVWNPADGKLRHSVKAGRRQVDWLALAPDESWIVALEDGETLSIWDTKTWQKRRDIPGFQFAQRVAVSPDGKTLASSVENDVRLVDVQGKELSRLQEHNDWVKAVQFSADGKFLVSAGGQTVRIWPLGGEPQPSPVPSPPPTGEAVATLRTDGADVHSVSFSRNGRWLAAAVDTSPEAQIYCWNAETLELYAKVPAGAGPLLDAHFRHDGKLVYQHSNGNVHVWEAGRKKQMRTLPIDDAGSPFGVSRNPNPLLAIGNRSGELVIADALTGNTLRRIAAHAEPVQSADITPDARLAATGSHDDTAKIWETATGKLIGTLPKQKGSYQVVAFSPDGKLLAGGSENALVLWDVAGGRVAHTLPGHESYTRCLNFSADGTRLVTGGDDRLVKVWDVSSGKLLASFSGHTDGVSGVAFSHDGSRVASGSFDGTVKLWSLAP